jgi:hypothetical protein
MVNFSDKNKIIIQQKSDKYRFIFLTFLFIVLIFSSSCRKNSSCSVSADLLYYGNLGECPFIIKANGMFFEPLNMHEWVNFLTYEDTQKVMIDYSIYPDFSQCSGIDQINVLCLTSKN